LKKETKTSLQMTFEFAFHLQCLANRTDLQFTNISHMSRLTFQSTTQANISSHIVQCLPFRDENNMLEMLNK